LYYAEEVLAEKGVRDCGIGPGEIVDHFQAHYEKRQSYHRPKDVDSQFKPVSAISRIVCLKAQTILSMKSLN
jgi:hypothetical protein